MAVITVSDRLGFGFDMSNLDADGWFYGTSAGLPEPELIYAGPTIAQFRFAVPPIQFGQINFTNYVTYGYVNSIYYFDASWQTLISFTGLSLYFDQYTAYDEGGFINLTAGNDSITGNGFYDLIRGGTGQDTLAGLGGDDWLLGDGGNDRLTGDAGDDWLEGGAGGDALIGGAGYDVAFYYLATSGVALSLAAGTGTGGDAAGDSFSSIESLLGSSFADALTGNDDHNVIEGGAGADTIAGLGGNDWVSFEFATGAIAVNLDSRTGWAGEATGDSITGVENIRGGAFADYLFGDGEANILRGDEGGDVLYGAGNSDTIYYSTSPAAVRVDLSTNSARGGHAEGDTLVSVENVFATAHDDTLIGDSASNTLVGWIGRDVMTGNGGNDIFRWSATTESGTTAATRDVVTDFWQAHGDLLDVAGIDADPFTAGDQAFAFIGWAAFSGAGQVRYGFDGLGNTVVELSTGGGTSGLQIQLTGTVFLVAGDLVL